MVAGFATVTLTVLDRLMERASSALLETRYAEAERLCRRALALAHKKADYERMARILMPLQEARRQKRQLACDAGTVTLVSRRGRAKPRPGCYLVEPPLVATDARDLRDRADAAGVPVLVLCREPMTKAGQWPIAGAGAASSGRLPLVVRTRVRPPAGARRDGATRTRDRGDAVPSLAWFEEAAEALGDAAIASVGADLHPVWWVDDLVLRLGAVPDHEKLHQRLEEACRAAIADPRAPRVRARNDGDPHCF